MFLSTINVSKTRRGMRSQELVKSAIRRYNRHNWACIHEVEVPKTITKEEAFYREKSTVDFSGIGYNRPVAFDVKSTRSRTRFDLSLVKEHQYYYLRRFHQQGGVAFILLHMIKHHKWFVIPFEKLERHMKEAQTGGRQSIPYEELCWSTPKVKEGGRTGLDFLEKIIKV